MKYMNNNKCNRFNVIDNKSECDCRNAWRHDVFEISIN